VGSNVSLAQASAEEVVLPERVQEALGQLVGSAKEGLLALSVGVGLGVLAELLEEEVVEVVGLRGKHDAERVAVRHGHESGEVTLGGRRVAVERPRVRSADGREELRLRTYESRPHQASHPTKPTPLPRSRARSARRARRNPTARAAARGEANPGHAEQESPRAPIQPSRDRGYAGTRRRQQVELQSRS
jgi:hypothetical protein